MNVLFKALIYEAEHQDAERNILIPIKISLSGEDKKNSVFIMVVPG